MSHLGTEQKHAYNHSVMFNSKDPAPFSDLQQRAHVAEEEVIALRQQHLILKNVCEKEREKVEQLQNELQKVSATIPGKDQEIAGLHQQIEKLNQQIATLKVSVTDPSLSKDFTSLQTIKEENTLLSKSLAENQQHSRQLERVIQFLRERGEEAHLEVKQLREEFQASREINSKHAQQLETLKEKEEQIEACNKKMADSHAVIHELEALLQASKASKEEKEQELKVSQQHLARKVKEVAILSGKCEEQHQKLNDLQQALLDGQSKLSSLQHHSDIQMQNEKNLQNQLNERLALTESQVRKWEEKYFQAHERCQQLEQKNRSLKSLEDKLQQAAIMLNNLNLLLEPPKVVPQEEASKSPAPLENVQSLFERPTNPAKHKKTLFD